MIREKNQGFTLVEMMISLAIFSFTMMAAMQMITNARKSASSISQASDMTSLSMKITNFLSVSDNVDATFDGIHDLKIGLEIPSLKSKNSLTNQLIEVFRPSQESFTGSFLNKNEYLLTQIVIDSITTPFSIASEKATNLPEIEPSFFINQVKDLGTYSQATTVTLKFIVKKGNKTTFFKVPTTIKYVVHKAGITIQGSAKRSQMLKSTATTQHCSLLGGTTYIPADPDKSPYCSFSVKGEDVAYLTSGNALQIIQDSKERIELESKGLIKWSNQIQEKYDSKAIAVTNDANSIKSKVENLVNSLLRDVRGNTRYTLPVN